MRLKKIPSAHTLYPMRSEPRAGQGARRSDPTRTWSRYRENVARHLIGISRDLESRVMRSLAEEAGFTGLRPSFGPLLSLIWKQGRSPTALAGELAISSQACGQLIDQAERAGYLAREPNPEDGRSKLVRLTPRGEELVAEGVRIILARESEYRALVGPAAYLRFTASLASLYTGLGIPTHADVALKARAGRSIGVLPLIAVRIQQELMKATIARGHAGLKMSHGQVLPHIGPEGGRIHAIARLHDVSRQAISATSRDLEALGYVRREPDPRDRRGVVLRLTTRGTRLIRDSLQALDGLGRQFRRVLGAKRLEQLEAVAGELYRALRLEEELIAEDLALGVAPNGANGRVRSGADIHQLATRLRRQLGSRDSARLAALLVPNAPGSASAT
jgi:DNA-binding MarR family transcriptional regulator